MNISEQELSYLKLLSKEYGNISEAAAKMINLTAIQNLPKGTEYYLSDIHGENEAFEHILRNASGTIRRKIDEGFPKLSEKQKKTLASIVYYPEEKLELLKSQGKVNDKFLKTCLERLLYLLKLVSFKYSRSHVRQAIPNDYKYILEELLYSETGEYQEFNYRDNLLNSIVESKEAENFIIVIGNLISRLSVYKLHILGDMYDRGPGGDIVVKTLMDYDNVDITWGNHDIMWMGAAAGNMACIANVIRICARYDNLHTLEVGYGISLRPLVTFAMKVYGNDPCKGFKTNIPQTDAMYETELESLRRIGKAISIMQFKLEGQLIDRHPHYEMSELKLLDKIDFKTNTVKIGKKDYPLTDSSFPTINPKDPYKLTAEEESVMKRLQNAFLESEALQSHVSFLLSKGSIYKCVNGNLLFHGSMPLTEKGQFDYINTVKGKMRGKAWFDYADATVRKAFLSKDSKEKENGVDFLWYLWCGYKSPLFGKKKITTFERLFIEDEATWKEEKNPYYSLMDKPEICDRILKEFNCNGIIINGHMPVKKGKSPIHADGKAIVIDGGFSRAYQKTTGIAGYSLVNNSFGFILSAHESFTSKADAVAKELDIHSTQVAKKNIKTRMLNKDTDQGKEIDDRIKELQLLIEAYRSGIIAQRK